MCIRDRLSTDTAVADFGVRTLLLAVRSVAKSLANVPGRKSMILFSSGFPLTPEAESELTATIDVCNKANVAIYPVSYTHLDVYKTQIWVPLSLARSGFICAPKC